MPKSLHCPVCQTALPENASEGVCPVCESSGALDPGDESKRPLPRGADAPNTDQSESRFISDLIKIRFFGDYEVLEEIASGGMGVVLKARQLSLNRIVALKWIRSGLFATKQEKSRFIREAELAANLRHPNIVSIHETGECEGQPYFSMDFISGKSLAELGRDRKVSIDQAVRYVITIAEAIHYAHQQSILHRDLKPSNVLIDADGQPRITDFGLAKRFESSLADCRQPELTKTPPAARRKIQSLTVTGQVLGSPHYMAPEQACSGEATRRSDVYGLGAVLYHLLAGEPPFQGGTVMEVLRKVMEEEPKHPSLLNRLVDRDLATVCLKCLEKDPQRRYPSAEALAADLRRWLRHEPVSARRAGPLLRLARWIERSPLRAALVAVSCVAIAVASWATYNHWIIKLHTRERERREWALLQDESSPVEQLHWFSEDLAGFFGERPRFIGDAKRLSIGVYLETDQQAFIGKFAPLLRFLEQSLSWEGSPLKIDLFVFRNRGILEEALNDANPKVHIGRMGEAGLSLLLSDPNVALVPLVQQASGGKVGVLFTRDDTGITNVAGLKDKRLALGSRTSTASGYKALDRLLQDGLDSQSLQETFHKESEQNVDLVLSGKFDAGVTRLDKFNAYAETNKTLRILAVFDTTRMPWVATKSLDPELTEKLRDAMVGLTSENDKAILQGLPENATGGFVKVDAEYFRKKAKDMKRVTDLFFKSEGSNQPPMNELK
jgi:serine/threonine protein kinase